MHTPLSINVESECGYAIIPPEKSLEYLHDEKEGSTEQYHSHMYVHDT